MRKESYRLQAGTVSLQLFSFCFCESLVYVGVVGNDPDTVVLVIVLR